MRTVILRSFALVAATTIIISGIQLSVTTPPANAERQEADFSLRVFPVAADTLRFTDTWGAARPGGRRHKGTDIVADRGTPILAVADGVVTEMDYRSTSGYYLRIEHADGWQTTYLHLNNDTYGTDDGQGGVWTAYYPTLTVGTNVFAGDVIGYVGDSGNSESTTPNTHFEIRQGDVKINPYPLLDAAWDREHRFVTDLTPR
ncbi:MAG: M23 family metallopeptidase [Actinomycetia bacterium]|nr:M23 family metallopeptidase [Actinomycetes bacterium]